ncbi:UNVERIFIED_ORG: hypothetical protein ABID57_000668 [Arthrobacter sp. UYEF1]
MSKPSRYINSPSWREGGKAVAIWLSIYAMIFGLTFLALVLTGGDR